MGPTLPPGGHHTAWCLQAQLATHAWHLPWGSQGLGALGWGVEVSMLLLHPGNLHSRQATQTHPPIRHASLRKGAAMCTWALHSPANHRKVQQSTAKCSKVQQCTAKHSNAQPCTAKHSKVQQCTASAAMHSNVQQCAAMCSKQSTAPWVTPTTACVNFEYSKAQQS